MKGNKQYNNEYTNVEFGGISINVGGITINHNNNHINQANFVSSPADFSHLTKSSMILQPRLVEDKITEQLNNLVVSKGSNLNIYEKSNFKNIEVMEGGQLTFCSEGSIMKINSDIFLHKGANISYTSMPPQTFTPDYPQDGLDVPISGGEAKGSDA